MEYEQIKDWIKGRLYNNKKTQKELWEWFEQRPSSQEDLNNNFVEVNNWPSITIDKWHEIFDEIKQWWLRTIDAGLVNLHLTLSSESEFVYPPSHMPSSWHSYLSVLRAKNWDADDLNNLCKSSFDTGSNLTQSNGPVKGLVVGQVQSGKTANFAGLIAMAADNGWNIYLVLSGTIESLRSQTQQRLLDDLWIGIRHSWIGLSKSLPMSSMDEDQCPCKLLLSPNNVQRYVKVCLKNAARLKNLRDWLLYDPNVAQKMRIIVIDDEADQAGINTLAGKEDATTINRLIRDIVHGGIFDPDTGMFSKKVTYGSMNYVGYTATPYANVLNETHETSLYPRDFIRCLESSKFYFGPSRIFGEPEHDGIDFWREIPNGKSVDYADLPENAGNSPEDNRDDMRLIQEIHNGSSAELPASLHEAICWYLCCAAAFRSMDIHHPSSMLIHTSQKIDHHTRLRVAIESWLKGNQNALFQQCERVWNTETARLTLDAFYRQCNELSAYPEGVRDYPSFMQFAQHLKGLLNNVSHIELEADGKEFSWNDGIHICEDNCRAGDDGEFHLRLLYPPKKKQEISHAFIVIGGNTLSRGLTLEGLVSSYFLRTSTTAIDTLTQMGRWFGFRKGYELFPRIWMTAQTLLRFKRISLSEKSLRDEILQFAILGKKPSEFGLRVLTHPHSRLNPTARNRMHEAQPGLDFGGNTIQTSVFYNDQALLESNRSKVAAFIEKIQRNKAFDTVQNSEKKLWREVPGMLIRELLLEYRFVEKVGDFQYVKEMVKWIEEQEKNDGWPGWNVALCGRDGNAQRWEPVPGVSIGKTNLQAYKEPKDTYNYYAFKTIRDRMDLLIDVAPEITVDFLKKMGKKKNDITAIDIWNVRKAGNVASTPQLLIYCLDRNYEKMNAPHDFIGFSIFFPGSNYRTTIKDEYLEARIKAAEKVDSVADIEDDKI